MIPVRQLQGLTFHCRLLQRRAWPAHEGIQTLRFIALVPQHRGCSSRYESELSSMWVMLEDNVQRDQRHRNRSAGDGFNLSLEAMNTLTHVDAVDFGVPRP